jgi:hypothetical protein
MKPIRLIINLFFFILIISTISLIASPEIEGSGDKSTGSFVDSLGIFHEINTQLQGTGSDGSYIGRSSSDWGDYDADGDLDVVITGFSKNGVITKIYRNDGNNVFSDINAPIQLVGRGCAKWGDYDNDGDLDLIVSGLGPGMTGEKTIVYRNDGNDTFTQAAVLEGVEFSSVSWGDYDNDGDLDIIVIGDNSSHTAITKIYRNDGNNIFTPVNANISGVYWGGADWGDYDNDGDLDLAITGANAYGYYSPITKIYRNNGDGTFTDINANLMGFSNSSITWGDYDNDGDLDFAVTGRNGAEASSKPYTKIYRNDGNGIFTDINAELPGISDGSVKFGDYDNDGDLDLIITGSTQDYNSVTILYENKGDGNFNRKTNLIGVTNSSISWGDYDGDGDLDLISTGDVGADQITKIYYNSLNSHPSKPKAPVNLQTEVDDNNVLLKWNNANSTKTTYNIYIGSSERKTNILSPMSILSNGDRMVAGMGNSGLNNSLQIKNLTYGKIYYWSAQAVDNSFTGSEFSPEESFHISIAKYQPKGLSADSGNHYAVLHWPKDEGKDILKYFIYYSTSSQAPVKMDSTARNTDTLFIVRNLQNNVKYYFWISALDLFNDESMLSKPAVTTPAKIPSLSFPVTIQNFPETGIKDSTKAIIPAYNNTYDTVSVLKLSTTNPAFVITGYPSLLAPNKSDYIIILFKPDTLGIYIDTLKIYTNEDTLYIPLIGKSPLPSIAIKSAKIDFLYVPKDSTRSAGISVLNNSVNRLIIDSVFAHTKYFSSTISDTVVLPFHSIILPIYFSPDSLGAFSDTLTLLSNSLTPTLKIQLTGNSKLAKMKFALNSVNFDSVGLLTEKTKTIKIYNLSANILEISSVKHTLAFFNFMPLPVYINGNDSLQFAIKCNPLLPGNYSDTAEIISNGGDTTIFLSSFSPFPEMNLDNSSLDFGLVKIDSILLKQISISNNSISVLKIDSVKSSTSYFRITGTAFPLLIGHNQSYQIKVSFKPDSLRVFKDSLEIFNNSLQSKFKIYLLGKGAPLVGVVDNSETPGKFLLAQNYPNPFNPATTISYSVPRTSFVTIKVFNALGEEITTLVSSEKQAGNYKLQFSAASFASGIYFYRMQATAKDKQGGDFVSTKKLILLK